MYGDLSNYVTTVSNFRGEIQWRAGKCCTMILIAVQYGLGNLGCALCKYVESRHVCNSSNAKARILLQHATSSILLLFISRHIKDFILAVLFTPDNFCSSSSSVSRVSNAQLGNHVGRDIQVTCKQCHNRKLRLQSIDAR